jgi:sec-independent protein translocase protein TatC
LSAHETGGGKAQPFLEHLEELRRVLIFCIAAVVVGAIAAWFFSDDAIRILAKSMGENLNFSGVTEAFYTRLKISVVLGFLVSLPVVLFRIWKFVVPGLFRSERVVLLPLVVVSTVLFFAGAAFAYLIVVPTATRFLLGFGSDVLKPVIMIGDYFTFVSRFTIVFGIVFQLPLVMGGLAYTGLVSSSGLLSKWRYAIVIVFVVAAILTPPDVASQVMMAGPLIVLYFLSVWIARVVEGRRRRAEKAGPLEEPEM